MCSANFILGKWSNQHSRGIISTLARANIEFISNIVHCHYDQFRLFKSVETCDVISKRFDRYATSTGERWDVWVHVASGVRICFKRCSLSRERASMAVSAWEHYLIFVLLYHTLLQCIVCLLCCLRLLLLYSVFVLYPTPFLLHLITPELRLLGKSIRRLDVVFL
jgi:hypothetical protein